jgi:hypothetical protein
MRPLSVMSAQHLAGFLSLLNGLLDQSGTATRGVAAVRQAKRPNATLLPPMKGQVERTTNAPDAKLRPALFPPAAPEAIAKTTVLFQPGESPSTGFAAEGPPIPLPGDTPASSAPPPSRPARVQSLGETSTASGTSILNGNTPSPPHDIAFALRLTWQPPRTNTDAMMARSNAILPEDSGIRNPIDGASRSGQLVGLNAGLNPGLNPGLNAGLNEVAPGMDSADTEKTKMPASDPETGESQSRRGGDQGVHSSFSLVQSIPARLLNSDPTVSESAGFRSSAISERIHHENVNASSSAPREQSPAPQAATNSMRIDVQPQVLTREPVSIPEKPTASSLPGADSHETPPPGTETRVEASTSLLPGQQPDPAPDVAPPTRPPLALSGGSVATQETSPSAAGNTMERDTKDSESDSKPPRSPITEKAPQTQNSNQPSSQAGAGVWLDRPREPGGATQTETKLSQPIHPPTPSPELESSSPVQTQPIREISFRLATASANVDVQVAQRAGKVQVAVRTADPDLAKSLQTNLGELVGRLEDKGFRTETWNPVAEQAGSSAVREPSNSANSQSQSDGSGSRGGQPGQRHGQQESNQRQPARWKSQLGETLSAPITSSEEEKLWYPQ